METMRPEQGTAPTIHAPQVGLAAPPPRPTTPGDEMLTAQLGQDPDTTPEALRGMAMTRSSIDTAHHVLGELEFRLAHVLADQEPEPPMDPGPVCHTAAGQYAASMYGEAARLERRVRSLLGRIRGV